MTRGNMKTLVMVFVVTAVLSLVAGFPECSTSDRQRELEKPPHDVNIEVLDDLLAQACRPTEVIVDDKRREVDATSAKGRNVSDYDDVAFEFMLMLYEANCGAECRSYASVPAQCFPPGGPVRGQMCNASLWAPFNLVVDRYTDSGAIGCDSSGQVSAISLEFCGLQNSIPASVALLTALNFLRLGSNSLSGSVPDSIWNLTNMGYLALDRNFLVGSIPAAIGNLLGMYYLDLGSNSFTGCIPGAIGKLVNLQSIYMYSNSLTGSIHDTFGNLTNLQRLHLDANSLTGCIPDAVGNLTTLRELYLYSNSLTGSIPHSIWSLPMLAELDVHSNQLTGSLPSSLESCSRLQFLGLQNKMLSGPLPVYVPDSLSIFLASYNHFTAPLDNGQWNLNCGDALGLFAAAVNNISGPLPSGDCPTEALFLSHNNFSGSISSLLSAGAYVLDVSSNPLLRTDCLFQHAATDPMCLPAFLTVNPNATVPGTTAGVLCSNLVSNIDMFTATLDAATYLLGSQCYCEPSYFAAPQSSGQLQCFTCDADRSTSVWCQCDSRGGMSACAATPAAVNPSLWLPLECPYIRAPLQTACSLPYPSNASSSNGACLEGYTDRRCSRCEENYFADGRLCTLCSPVLRWLLPVIYVAAVVVFVVYLIKVPGSAAGVLKITTFYIQSALILVQNPAVPWPYGIQNLFQAASQTGSLSLTAVECVVTGISETARYVMYMLIPVVLVCVAAIVYVIRRARGSNDSWDVFVYMSVTMLVTTYFDVTVKTFAGLSCTLHDLADPKYRYLNMYPWISCNAHNGSGPFATVLAVSVVMFVCYIVGIPALLFGMLWRRRGVRTSDTHVQRQLGFVYAAYRENVYWWDAVLLLRRVLLAVSLTMVPFTVNALSVVAIGVLLIVAIILQHAMEPYASALENRLELAVLVVLLTSFLGIYVTEVSASSPVSLDWLPVVVVVLNVLMLLVLLGVLSIVFLAKIPSFVNWLRSRTKWAFLPKLDANAGVHLQKRLMMPDEL